MPDFGFRIFHGFCIALTACAVVLFGLMTSPAMASGEEELTLEQHLDEGVEHRGIEIDVRVGARRVLLTMGVPDTIVQGGEADEVAANVESILRHNLDLSGYFQVLPSESYFFDTDAEGMSAATISFANWFNVGAQGLVKSAVREVDGAYELDLRLFAVERGREIELEWSAPESVGEDGVRREVNRFINAVLKHYTGAEGIFGTRIAYSRRYNNDVKQIYTMEMDGSDQRRISRGNAISLVPTFGPDGAVYFTDYGQGNPDLYRYRDGSLRVISNAEGQNSGAAYCGGKLALTMSRGTANTDIYLVDPDTGAVLQQLTDNWSIDVSPTWSPDCSKIAFVSSRSGGGHIFVMNADGTEQRRLTFQGSYNTTPDWSPRGDRIVFSGRDEFHKFDLFTVDLEGNIERLTQDQGNNSDPAYSPDGRYIVFASDREGGQSRLWLTTHDGQVQRPLTREGQGFEEPAWER